MKKISLLIAALYSSSALADGTAQTIVLLHSGAVNVTNNVSGLSTPLTTPGAAVSVTSTGSISPFKGPLPSTDTHASSSGGGKSASNGKSSSEGGAQGSSNSQNKSSGNGGSSQPAQNGSSSQSSSGESSGGASQSGAGESAGGASQSGSGGESSAQSTQNGSSSQASSGEASGSRSGSSGSSGVTTLDTGSTQSTAQENGNAAQPVVQPATTTTSQTSTSTGTTTNVTSSVPQQVVTATPTTSTGTSTVNLTTQTATTSTGQTTTITSGTTLVGTQAQAAAAAAAAKAAAVGNLALPLSTTSVSAAISSANSTITTASTAEQTASTALNDANTAKTVYTTNSSYADNTAHPAVSAIQTADTTIQSAQTAVSTAKTDASTSLNNATSALSAADKEVATITTSLSTISDTQTALSSNSTSAQILEKAGVTVITAPPTTVQEAATVAQTAATQAQVLQAAGDVTGAQAALATAQAAQAIVDSAIKANSSISTATSEADNATTKITSVSSQIDAINTATSTISSNFETAQYKNPEYAGNFIGHFMMPVAGTGGYNFAEAPNNPAQPNTSFVLDGNGNLVESRSTSFQVTDPSTATAVTSPLSGADVKWTGGTAADTFKLADNSIYGGRWVNPTVTVTDSNTNAVTTYTPADGLWVALLAPPVNYVQSLTGTTTYTLAENTTPYDAAGVVGNLNSATLTANFTNQTVDASLSVTMPSGAMAGTYSARGTAMPIQSSTSVNPAGFSVGTQTVNCTTGACNAGSSGYSVNLGGSFAGNTASSAGLGYNIWPTATGAASDMIQGLVAFTASTAPTTGTAAAYNPNNVAFAIADPNYYSGPVFIAFNNAEFVPASGLTYTGGGLTSINDSSIYSLLGCNSCSFSTTLIGAASPVTGSSTSGTTGIQFGRWTTATGIQGVYSYPLGGGFSSSNWIVGPKGYLDSAVVAGSSTGPLTGTFNYVLDGANAPVDTSSGTKGTLTSASLAADFTNQKVSANLALSMGGTNWSASSSGMAIANGQFSDYAYTGGTMTVSKGGTACTTCGGSLSGAFTGQNYAGAILSYSLYDNTVYIGGNAAFTRNVSGNPQVTNATPAPTGQYWVSDYGGILTASSITSNSANALIGYNSPSTTNGSFTNSSSVSVTCTTCTGNASGDVANTGIYYGVWDSGTYSSTNTASWTGAAGQYHWITGPEVGPVYLSQVLTGSLNFALDGATAPTNQSGVAGTLNSAAMVVDFDAQTVAVSLGLTVNSHVWKATTTNNTLVPPAPGTIIGVPLVAGMTSYGSNTFFASGSNLNVTVDNTVASGTISGQLTGTGVTGAILDYNLTGTVGTGTESVNGVAAFAAPSASNTATPYQVVGVAATDSVFQSALTGTQLGVGFDAQSRLAASNGGLTVFDATGISAGSAGASMTLNIHTSTAADTGSDPVSGISWGRWQGGTVDVMDRASGISTAVNLAGSLHWIAGPVETSPVTLPTSGTFTYTLAGGTHPTDNNGLVGTLNSASLAADFTHLTVNVGVNATVSGSTMVAQATNVPIIQKAVFQVDTLASGTSGKLTVNCTGTCGTSSSGQIAGAFTGAGATGAAIMYTMERIGGTSPGSISGVAAFNR